MSTALLRASLTDRARDRAVLRHAIVATAGSDVPRTNASSIALTFPIHGQERGVSIDLLGPHRGDARRCDPARRV